MSQDGDDRGSESASDLEVLREVTLRHVRSMNRPVTDSGVVTVIRRLSRLHLTWLAAPWQAIAAFRLFFGDKDDYLASEGDLVQTYRRFRHLDPGTAKAEVHRLAGQLATLDDQTLMDDLPPVGQDGLRRAAGALIQYYLAGRSTEDPALERVMGRWADHEEFTQQALDRLHDRGAARSLIPSARDDRANKQLLREHALAWRAWLNDQHGPGAE
jgi:hypothetical protein